MVEEVLEQDDVIGSIGGAEAASAPSPGNETEDVSRDVVLSWTPGSFAVTHDVYFGNSFDDVNAADPALKIQLQKAFSKYAGAVVVIETGTHSPWVSRELKALGCKVLVANARKVRAIWARSQKTDVKDAEMLARIARMDPKLLYPIHHRSQKAQVDLEQIKTRDLLVRLRTDRDNTLTL
ncbi:MAG: transposase [Planctomycetes bacterium]|nr:transposase [Planctomycetota bacterium]